MALFFSLTPCVKSSSFTLMLHYLALKIFSTKAHIVGGKFSSANQMPLLPKHQTLEPPVHLFFQHLFQIISNQIPQFYLPLYTVSMFLRQRYCFWRFNSLLINSLKLALLFLQIALPPIQASKFIALGAFPIYFSEK